MQSSPSFYEESNVHYQLFLPFRKRNIPWEPSFILREQSRVKGQGTWLVRAPHPALGFMWKACPLGNEDTSLTHTQPVGLVSPQPPPNPFSLHPRQTLSHHGPPYTSESTPLCNAERQREKITHGFGLWYDGWVWQVFMEVETKGKESKQPKHGADTWQRFLCWEKNSVQGKRSKEGFRSSLKEAYWLTARRKNDLYGVHGSMMDFFLYFFSITTIPEG